MYLLGAIGHLSLHHLYASHKVNTHIIFMVRNKKVWRNISDHQKVCIRQANGKLNGRCDSRSNMRFVAETIYSDGNLKEFFEHSRENEETFKSQNFIDAADKLSFFMEKNSWSRAD